MTIGQKSWHEILIEVPNLYIVLKLSHRLLLLPSLKKKMFSQCITKNTGHWFIVKINCRIRKYMYNIYIYNIYIYILYIICIYISRHVLCHSQDSSVRLGPYISYITSNFVDVVFEVFLIAGLWVQLTINLTSSNLRSDLVFRVLSPFDQKNLAS